MTAKLYERIVAHGASGLSDAELIHVLLRAGSARVPVANTVAALLGAYPALAGLAQADGEALQRLAGIGLSKAAGLLAAIEFGRRVTAQTTHRFGSVLSSQALGEALVRRWAGATQERVLAVFLDSQLAVIQEAEVALGAMNEAQADPRVVFGMALRLNAPRVLLAHNHPSGSVTPSDADRLVTARFAEAGRLLGIELVDHLIIGRRDYYAFAEHDEQLNFFK